MNIDELFVEMDANKGYCHEYEVNLSQDELVFYYRREGHLYKFRLGKDSMVREQDAYNVIYALAQVYTGDGMWGYPRMTAIIKTMHILLAVPPGIACYTRLKARYDQLMEQREQVVKDDYAKGIMNNDPSTLPATIACRIRNISDRYDTARAKLQKKEEAEIADVQKDCERVGHNWQWHQVAGEGRYCRTCGLVDIECDD